MRAIRKFLSRLKRQPTVNGLGRPFVRGLARRCRAFARLDHLISRWSVSGVLDLNLWGLRFKYSAAADDVLADLMYYDPEQWWQMELFIALARRCGVLIDVGANTGLNSILAGIGNPTAKIYAFEPHPSNYGRLLQNLELNHLRNVVALQQAVGAEVGELELSVPNDLSITQVASAVGEFSEGFLGADCRRIQVPAVTIDAFVRHEGLAKVDLLKIDVEYYENEVLAGASETIASARPLVWCEVLAYEFAIHNDPRFSKRLNPNHADRIERFMASHDYAFYSIQPHGLVRVDSLVYSPSQDNFLFSPRRSSARFLPYARTEELLVEIMPQG